MITRDPEAFLHAFAALPYTAARPATARAAFMVAPSHFGLAGESAQDNAYMRMQDVVDPQRAARQHAALAEALRDDVPVVTFPGIPDAPDAVFPNNVFATRPGALVVGRMRHAVRRREALRADIRGFFRDVLGYEEIDLSGPSQPVAELTGSLVIDHARGVGFCGLGERCTEAGAAAMHRAFGLQLTFCFDLAPGEYHANVLMTALAGRGVLLVPDGFRDSAAAEAVARAYEGRVVMLEAAQKERFAANAITLDPHRVWMSGTAVSSLSPAQCAQLERLGFRIGAVELDEIEKAGGSLRCCVAEIF
ncbi:arginine deiminase-related protein [Oleiagrimonas sp. MCCC 1A03011]|uniref:arginine deiminase-related protein n=1 Tax=Oleiagrimonas sp. MCCC 1A03011 TaxID=1926883 RepID=UPI000DC347FE|nr:arginine deiminase-related protein [Oleiagrimonas sp. MCCC 1A03011]RAP57708.1 amidinotransferase [Oleiagrimonas sp. MCCC 1A03011]